MRTDPGVIFAALCFLSVLLGGAIFFFCKLKFPWPNVIADHSTIQKGTILTCAKAVYQLTLQVGRWASNTMSSVFIFNRFGRWGFLIYAVLLTLCSFFFLAVLLLWYIKVCAGLWPWLDLQGIPDGPSRSKWTAIKSQD